MLVCQLLISFLVKFDGLDAVVLPGDVGIQRVHCLVYLCHQFWQVCHRIFQMNLLVYEAVNCLSILCFRLHGLDLLPKLTSLDTDNSQLVF